MTLEEAKVALQKRIKDIGVKAVVSIDPLSRVLEVSSDTPMTTGEAAELSADVGPIRVRHKIPIVD